MQLCGFTNELAYLLWVEKKTAGLGARETGVWESCESHCRTKHIYHYHHSYYVGIHTQDPLVVILLHLATSTQARMNLIQDYQGKESQ